MPYLAVDGDRKLYYEHYEGSGRPVVLIHGWGMGARVWDTTLAALLLNKNEVVVFDQRACALSDKDFSDMTVEAQHLTTGTELGFNGTTEWALDSVAIEDAQFFPKIEQEAPTVRADT